MWASKCLITLANLEQKFVFWFFNNNITISIRGKSGTRVRKESHLHSSHQVLFGWYRLIYLYFTVSFPEVYCVNFHAKWVVFSERTRHSLVEAGSSAVLVTMALKYPASKVLFFNNQIYRASVSPHKRTIYWVLFQANWESRKSFLCRAEPFQKQCWTYTESSMMKFEV